MTELDRLADELATSGRTLRRAATRGTIHCHRPSPRRIAVPPSERAYVRRHWPLLRSLVEVLRTQPHVRLAVLFGSLARGDEQPGSDLDVLVRLRDDTYLARAGLAELLEEASGRRVQLVSLLQAQESALLLADVLHDGRVLVDREGDWPVLRRREPAIRRRALKDNMRLEEAAWAAGSLGGSP
jgi:predicted nucleotidyltransferase